MIKQALIGLTAAALLAGCGGEDKAQAPAAKAADGTKTVQPWHSGCGQGARTEGDL